MPILRGAVTFARFRVEGLDKRENQWILKNLRTHAFEPIPKGGEDERAQGFVELENRDGVEFPPGAVHQGEYALFAFRVDTLKVPGAQLREELEKWTRAFEGENSRPASRREKNDAKAALKATLRSKTTPRIKTYDVSWNLKSGELAIWAASRKAVEEAEAAIEKCFDVQLHPLAPAAAAESLGIKDEDLSPTPDLSWPGFEEARDGKA